jgi:L-histidine Nalpha-methyltransferase
MVPARGAVATLDASASSPGEAIAADVRAGLEAVPKRLPPYLFYDDEGSRLYEQITVLPEYYLTRTERAILEAHADEIVGRASRGPGPLRIIELGAGSATKTELLLRAAQRRQRTCVYVPVDVSRSAIDDAKERLARELPEVVVQPLVMPHFEAFRHLRRRGATGPDLVLFIGSSIGNFDDDEAIALLAGVHDALGPRASLLLGTDLRKSTDVLLRAYDDRAGVTAAFNKNLLSRLNRELDGDFDLSRFRHVARWNEAASRIEMHLESTARQVVTLRALQMQVAFEPKETIHTESSVKYDLPHVTRLLTAAGFRPEESYYDEDRRFAVHLAGE